MAQSRSFLKLIGNIPLIRFQRSAVRYRLRFTEPGDCATRQRDHARRSSMDCSIGDRIAGGGNGCEVRP